MGFNRIHNISLRVKLNALKKEDKELTINYMQEFIKKIKREQPYILFAINNQKIQLLIIILYIYKQKQQY